jgi:hypothetical protein
MNKAEAVNVTWHCHTRLLIINLSAYDLDFNLALFIHVIFPHTTQSYL